MTGRAHSGSLRHPDRSSSGLLVVDKPPGQTSHDVVAAVRRLTGVHRVGHTGTLDPMATGVLVICLGWTTRLVEYMIGLPKTYLAQITLGLATDSYDATGTPTWQAPVPSLSRQSLEESLQAFRGPILQRPPAYSALKRDGQALYKRARRGEVVELEPRPVEVYELTLLDLQDHLLEVRVTCSAGTYVRSIAHDLGQALGCGGHLSWLRRTAVGPFDLEQAVQPDRDGWREQLKPPESALTHLACLQLTPDQAMALAYGQPIPVEAAGQMAAGKAGMLAQAQDSAGHLLAVVQLDRDRRLWRPSKVFVQPD